MIPQVFHKIEMYIPRTQTIYVQHTCRTLPCKIEYASIIQFDKKTKKHWKKKSKIKLGAKKIEILIEIDVEHIGENNSIVSFNPQWCWISSERAHYTCRLPLPSRVQKFVAVSIRTNNPKKTTLSIQTIALTWLFHIIVLDYPQLLSFARFRLFYNQNKQIWNYF